MNGIVAPGAGSGSGTFPCWLGGGSSSPNFIARINFAVLRPPDACQQKRMGVCFCSHCRERYYPQIAPCIIVAIRRAMRSCWRNIRAIRNGVHTVLAGFVEVGETLEQAVAREVMEESGIRVKKICVRDLSPMAVPAVADDRLYGGFADGEIVVDKKELLTADWYRYDDPRFCRRGDSGAAAYRRYRRDVSGRVRVTCYTGRITLKECKNDRTENDRYLRALLRQPGFMSPRCG